jgi:Transmembrane domain of unknown function (DUF3566)
VDEAGRTTQPPLIMAPSSLKADPDGEATDTILDNGTMSSSQTGTDEDTAEAGPSSTVPLPADSIGSATGWSASSSGSTGNNGRGSERQGSRKTMTSGDSIRLTARKTETAESDDSTDAAASVAAAAAPASAPASTEPAASPATAGSSRSATGKPYAATSYAPPSSYSRSDWSTPAGSPPGSAASGGATGTARPSASAATPAGSTTRSAAPSGNGYSPANGFSSGDAPAGGGAAAGLAGAVPPAWQQQRGPTRNVQTRKSAKRQAMLTLARVEPWSVMKFSFVASVVAFVILFVAVAVLYMVLAALGVFDSLQHTVSSITSSQSDAGTNISHWFSASLILGYTAMLGALNIVLITAMSTVGSVVYNLIAKTIGGIEVTLRETD